MATRAEIRSAVAQLISECFTLSVPYAMSSVDVRDFPVAMSYIENGRTEGDYDGGYDTDASLTIEIWTRSTSDIELELDQLANHVNRLIDADETLGGLVDGITRDGFSYERDSESFVGTLFLNYQVTFEDGD